jgi:hypothetical protein
VEQIAPPVPTIHPLVVPWAIDIAFITGLLFTTDQLWQRAMGAATRDDKNTKKMKREDVGGLIVQ